MELENILSEVSQAQKTKNRIFSLISGSSFSCLNPLSERITGVQYHAQLNGSSYEKEACLDK
jgi:hypothetical protein